MRETVCSTCLLDVFWGKTLKLENNKRHDNITIFRLILLMAVHFHSACYTVWTQRSQETQTLVQRKSNWPQYCDARATLFQLCHAWWEMWANIHNYTTRLTAALTSCASPPTLNSVGATKIWLIIINMHHSLTHTHSQFIFHHCGRPQRIEEMLICPAAFLFGAGADDDPALGPVGPHLQQNHYSIIFMQILPEENKQAR